MRRLIRVRLVVSASQKSASYTKLVSAYADSLLGDGTPAAKAVVKASPTLGQVAAAVSLAAPFVVTLVVALRDAYAAALYTLPWHMVELLSGLFLCFFGGEFYALIACYEAFYACGGPNAAAAAQTVVDEAQAVVKAAQDNKTAPAAGGDTAQATVRRNVLLFAQNTHPEALTSAVAKLWVTWLGMMATMKLKLARTMVLGTRISKALVPVANRHVLPRLEATMPAELHKWNATLLDLGVTACVLLVSSFLSSLVAAFHAALRGGQLAAKHGVAVLAARGTLKGPVDDKLIHTVGLLLSSAGVLAQAGLGFRLPFPLNVLLLPFTFAELMLRVTIGFSSL